MIYSHTQAHESRTSTSNLMTTTGVWLVWMVLFYKTDTRISCNVSCRANFCMSGFSEHADAFWTNWKISESPVLFIHQSVSANGFKRWFELTYEWKLWVNHRSELCTPVELFQFFKNITHIIQKNIDLQNWKHALHSPVVRLVKSTCGKEPAFLQSLQRTLHSANKIQAQQ